MKQQLTILLLDIDSTSMWLVIVAINFVWGFIIGRAIYDIKKILHHSRAQTKIMSLIAVQLEVPIEDVNIAVEEINDENPLLFSYDVEDETAQA